MHEDPEIANGISCGRIYSPSESLVTCTVLVPDALPVSSLNKRDIQDCFANGHGLTSILDGLINAPTLPETANTNTTATTTTVNAPTSHNDNDKRQNPCGIWFFNTVSVMATRIRTT